MTAVARIPHRAGGKSKLRAAAENFKGGECTKFEELEPHITHLCIAPATHGKSDIEAVGAQVEIAI